MLHHIIDPQTSLPTSGPFRTVTVRRGSQILNFEVMTGTLGVYADLARIGQAKSEAESPAPAPSR